jgi:phosphatidylinositol alpha-mannosyltransferase
MRLAAGRPERARGRLVAGDGDRTATPKTVLFVSLSGWQAGPGRSLATLLAHLPPDIDPVLACPASGNLLPAVLRRSRLKTHVTLPRRRGQQPDLICRLQVIAILAFWIIRHRREILAVHANGFSELHVAAPGAIIARRRLIVWFHGHEENPWDARLGGVWNRLLRSRRLVAVSKIASRRAADAGVAPHDEIAIIPNPIDPEDVLANYAIHTAPASGPIVVGYLGGERRRKGFYELPDLVERLIDTPVTWAVFDQRTGTEDSSEEAVWRRLEAAGNTRLKIWGRVDDVRDAYAACDLVIALSKAESFSRGVAEPMLNGIPVVATDIEAHRLLLGEDEAGLLFPVGDLGAAAEAIRLLAADGELRRTMGEAGRARTAAFAPELVVSRFAALYRGEA